MFKELVSFQIYEGYPSLKDTKKSLNNRGADDNKNKNTYQKQK